MAAKIHSKKSSSTPGIQTILKLLMTCYHRVKPAWTQLSVILQVLWVTFLSTPDFVVAFYHLIVPRTKKCVKNEIVLVTGSGQGIGRALCLKFAALGSELVCVDIDAEQNLETVREVRALGARARSYLCNVADRTAVVRLAEEVGRVDILVNNAGCYPVKGLWNASERELRTVVDVNLMSQFWTVQAFLPGMKARDHGHVVSVASMAGLMGLAYHHPYAVAKAGLSGLMRTLDHELRIENRPNIKLTTIYPYFIKTRHEVTDCIDTRIPAVEVDVAVEDMMKGILQDLVSFTVPRDMIVGFNLTNIFPQGFSDRWNKMFFATMNEPEKDLFKVALEKGQLDHTGKIQVQ